MVINIDQMILESIKILLTFFSPFGKINDLKCRWQVI